MAGGKTDKAVALLQTLKSLGGGQGETGLHIVTVRTSEPGPVTFVMQGTKRALGLDIFEIPVDCYPLREGDQLLGFPLAGGEGGSSRWAILVKLNGGLVMATMQSATSCKPDGMAVTYEVTAPAYFAVGNTGTLSDSIKPLQAGARVSIAPTWDGSQVQYVILNKY